MRVRAARIEEAEALTALCRRSKAAWGYDEAFMAASAASLTVGDVTILAGRAFVAEDADGALLGVATYERLETPGDIELDLLFVEPGSMRGGIGKALLGALIEGAVERGAQRMLIVADPHAAGFYERCGAARIGDAPSEAIPGRMLPLFLMTLA